MDALNNHGQLNKIILQSCSQKSVIDTQPEI